jgi:hypothetical protein
MEVDPVILWSTAKRFGIEEEGRVPVNLPVPGLGRVRALVHPEYVTKDSGYLLHLGLTAHLRLLLGLPAERWRYPKRVGEAVPDAEALLEEGTYAVEVDLTYPLEKVTRKVEVYKRAYDGQIWAVTARTHARRVRSLAWPKPVQVLALSLKEVVE